MTTNNRKCRLNGDSEEVLVQRSNIHSSGTRRVSRRPSGQIFNVQDLLNSFSDVPQRRPPPPGWRTQPKPKEPRGFSNNVCYIEDKDILKHRSEINRNSQSAYDSESTGLFSVSGIDALKRACDWTSIEDFFLEKCPRRRQVFDELYYTNTFSGKEACDFVRFKMTKMFDLRITKTDACNILFGLLQSNVFSKLNHFSSNDSMPFNISHEALYQFTTGHITSCGSNDITLQEIEICDRSIDEPIVYSEIEEQERSVPRQFEAAKVVRSETVKEERSMPSQFEATKVFRSIVDHFVENVPSVRRRWFSSKRYSREDIYFVGCEAVDFLLQALPMIRARPEPPTREQVTKLLQFMMKENVFVSKKGGSQQFSDNRSVFKFL